MKTELENKINEQTESVSVGLDSRNRVYGYSIHTLELDAVETQNEYSYGLKPGHYFVWRGQATRSGNYYGASQPHHYCETEAERTEGIANYKKHFKGPKGGVPYPAAPVITVVNNEVKA